VLYHVSVIKVLRVSPMWTVVKSFKFFSLYMPVLRINLMKKGAYMPTAVNETNPVTKLREITQCYMPSDTSERALS